MKSSVRTRCAAFADAAWHQRTSAYVRLKIIGSRSKHVQAGRVEKVVEVVEVVEVDEVVVVEVVPELAHGLEDGGLAQRTDDSLHRRYQLQSRGLCTKASSPWPSALHHPPGSPGPGLLLAAVHRHATIEQRWSASLLSRRQCRLAVLALSDILYSSPDPSPTHITHTEIRHHPAPLIISSLPPTSSYGQGESSQVKSIYLAASAKPR